MAPDSFFKMSHSAVFYYSPAFEPGYPHLHPLHLAIAGKGMLRILANFFTQSSS